MDVVLGVAVTGRVARLAMVGSPASGGQVFDQYALDLSDGGGMTDLAETIVGTYREVAGSGNRVAAIRLCLPDASEAETLRQTVASAGAQNVEVVAESEAAAALARSAGADAALLLADDTVSLTKVGGDEESTSVLASLPIGVAGAAAASAAVLQAVPEAPTRIMLVGQRLDLDSIAAELRTTVPVEVPPDAGYAIARGAAQTASGSDFPAGAATMMAPAAGDATMMAPAAGEATQMAPAADATQMAPTTDPAAVGAQLAYSEEEPEQYELPYESLEEFVPELEDEQAYTAMIAPPPPKTVLMGSAFAFVVVAFATLAVSVAVAIRPVADVSAQPAPPVQPQTVPGRFLPEVPHQPDPVALPIAVVSPAPAAPAVRVPVNRGPNPVVPLPQLPQAPVVGPGPVPVPAVPVPGVPVVPPFNPFPTLNPFPTWTTTVTTSVTPTTTTTTPTTTTTTPTTTSTTPTTTTTGTTTSEETSTSSSQPSTIPTVPPEPEPPASQAPAYTPPASQAPAYTPPAEPAYTPPALAPEPAAPELPSSGSGSDSGSGGSFEEPVTTVPLSP